MLTSKQLHTRRSERARYNIAQKANGRPRLSIYRSGQHIYAQVIDDKAGRTLAAASTVEKDLRAGKGTNKEAAKKIGALVAERALKAGVKQVVFDRGGYVYHGRVKELAEAARAGGLDF